VDLRGRPLTRRIFGTRWPAMFSRRKACLIGRLVHCKSASSNPCGVNIRARLTRGAPGKAAGGGEECVGQREHMGLAIWGWALPHDSWVEKPRGISEALVSRCVDCGIEGANDLTWSRRREPDVVSCEVTCQGVTAMRTRLLVCALLATSCATSAASRPAPRIDPGRPSFDNEKSGGFWIWADSQGWHLRTTSAGPQRLMNGVVTPLGGKIEDLRVVRGDPSQRVRLTDRGIEFDFATQADVDGFDWRVTSGCNRFDLVIDGNRTQGVVRLGGMGSAPDAIPFELCQ